MFHWTEIEFILFILSKECAIIEFVGLTPKIQFPKGRNLN